MPDDIQPADKSSKKSKKSATPSQTSKKGGPEPLLKTKDYVAATLNAWNNCPSIVKKQLDKQNQEMAEVKSKLKETELKLAMRKTDFERIHSLNMKKDLMKHKENIEAIYKRKLEDEKRKLIKQRVDEVHKLMEENKSLKEKIQAKW